METGRPNETAPNRKKMMEKRMRKLHGVEFPFSVERTGDEQPDILLVGVGSNIGAIGEAMGRLKADGLKVAHVQVRALLPFPTNLLQNAIQDAKQVVVVENNATGQLRNLMSFFNVHHDRISNLLKYDGTPFLPVEIYRYCKELV
jgi:2-oxoglutarate ferredoxin oxidoreductase subunit alpha